MNVANPNLPLLESVVAALGPLSQRSFSSAAASPASSSPRQQPHPFVPLAMSTSLSRSSHLANTTRWSGNSSRLDCVMIAAATHQYAAGWLVPPSST